MTEAELRQAYEMFTDLWRLYKRFGDSNNTDEYWNALSKQVEAYRKKHTSRLSDNLLNQILDEFERTSLE